MREAMSKPVPPASLASLASLALILPAVACDAQVDADHRGIPLARLAGTVRNTRTLSTGDAEVVVVWTSDGAVKDASQPATAHVAERFPARFTLSIYEPPAEYVLNDWPGARFGVAFIFTVLVGTDYYDDRSARAGLLGMDTEHLLVYAPDGIPEGSFASYLLRGTPAPGFHLYGVRHLTEEEEAARRVCIDALGPDPDLPAIFTGCGGDAFDDFVPLPDDLHTPLEIELVDDPSTIDPPNWM
jgi:hypothetical protein